MTIENRKPSRRTLIKGVAWATPPVIAASTTIPAYAASACNPVGSVSHLVNNLYATNNTGNTKIRGNESLEITQNQYMVRDLPEGVYLTKAVSVIWLRQKLASDPYGPGTWPMDASSAKITYNGSCSDSNCGWSQLKLYKKGVKKTKADGTSITSWAMALSWTAKGTTDAPINFTYNGSGSSVEGCYTSLTDTADGDTSTSPQATKYRVDYTNVQRTTAGREDQGYWQWTWFYLSDNTILTYNNTKYGYNPNDPVPATPPTDLPV